MSPPSPFEDAIIAGAVSALRKRAAVQREKAALGITRAEPPHGDVLIIASEARAALNLANDLEEIADELEVEGSK